MTLELHPLAEMFPPMDPDRLAELANDIKENGQLLPIVLHENKILDGRSRYLAARMAGREPVTVDFNAAEYNRSPVEFVFSMNMHRRDLTPSMRAAIAAELVEQMRYKTGPSDRRDNIGQKLGNGEDDEPENPTQMPQRSRKDAAKQARVSTGYVAEAAALKREDPAAFEEVKAGKKSLRQATKAKREKSAGTAETLMRIELAIGPQARDMIKSCAVKLTPKQLMQFSMQPPATMERIYSLLFEGVSYADATKGSGQVLTMESTLDQLNAKWIEECGAPDIKNKVLTVCIGAWRITVERIAGRPITAHAR